MYQSGRVYPLMVGLAAMAVNRPDPLADRFCAFSCGEMTDIPKGQTLRV